MPCPICTNETQHKFRPFCSKRCADIDLHKWLTGGYTLEGDDEREDNPKLMFEHDFGE